MQVAGDGSKGTRRHAAQVSDRHLHRTPMEEPMHRRNILMGTFTAAGALMAATVKGARANAAEAGKSKVVYHLCDLDKVVFVLGNISLGHGWPGQGDYRVGRARPRAQGRSTPRRRMRT
jgi:hypothetical protein